MSQHSCPEPEQLKAWVDRETAPSTESAITAHVNGCTRCTEEVRIMRQLGGALKELDSQVEPPANLRQRILASTVETAPRASSRGRWLPGNPFQLLRWAMAAAVVAVIAFIGLNNLPAGVPALTPDFSTRVADIAGETGGQAKGSVALPASPMGGAMPAAPRGVPGVDRNGEIAGMRDEWAYPQGRSGGAAMPMAGMPGSPLRNLRQRAARAPALVPGAPAATPDDVNTYARGVPVDDVTRKVKRIAVLSVRTRSALEGIQKEIEKRLKKDDGYVESANLSTPEGGERTIAMRLRVPVDKLDEYVTWLASLGEVRAKNVRGEDITGTWIDQRAEVRELRKEEARLLKVYNTDPSREKRNEARWQLLRIRPRIAASEERFALSTKLATLSTIELTLVEPAQARIQGNLWQDIDGTTRSAIAAFMVALRVPAALLIWLVVFCPLWLPCVLVYRWASRRAGQWQGR